MRKFTLMIFLLLINNGLFAQVKFNNCGGGEDYFDFINQYTVLVHNKVELLQALQKDTGYGTIIYISDTAEIDLSEEMDLDIAKGVTLASGRGKKGSLGALLYSNYHVNNLLLDSIKKSLFCITNGSVRITGLRLKGPDGSKNPLFCSRADPSAINVCRKEYGCNSNEDDFTNQLKNIKIDNNEMYCWPGSCVKVNFVNGVSIRYNFLHNNLRESTGSCRPYGLGYGVVNYGGYSFVTNNIFSHNRHDVACSGHPASNYEFRDNLVLNGGTHQSVDVHGWHEARTSPPPPTNSDGSFIAGNNFKVEDNYFLHSGNHFWTPTILIRGVPHTGLSITNNDFVKWESHTIQQKFNGSQGSASDSYKNVTVKNNRYGLSPSPIIFISYSGKSYWSYRRFKEDKGLFSFYSGLDLITKKTLSSRTKKYVSGNFTGDERADLFYADGNNWFVSESGKKDWENINHSNINPGDLRFCDFDGDGITDIFRTNGSHWYVSAHGGKDSWAEWNNSQVSLSELRFGDFDGNGKADVLRVAGGKWRISWDGKSGWEDLNTSDVAISQLLFGDFDGNGKTDVLRVADNKWRISREGRGRWEDINTSNISISNLRLGDFNGDGGTDIFRSDNGKWWVSYNATSAWQQLNFSDENTGNLFFGDFNADKKTDVLVTYKNW